MFGSLLARQTFADVPWQDGRSKAGDLQISLITFSPGDNINDWFGHTALAVQDTVNNIARVYNFGLFSFDDGFLTRFAMGRLIFWAGDASLGAIMSRYMKADRTISFQILNLPPQKKLQLAKKLTIAVLPENSHYLYHHYNENCATRLRDLIDEAVDGALYRSTDKPAGLTFREHTRRYTAQSPLMQWLLMFLMNDSIDKPIKQWDEMFLPDELAKYVDMLQLHNPQRPFVQRSFVYYDSHRPPVPENTSSLPLWTIMAGFSAGLIAFAAGRRAYSEKNKASKYIFRTYHLFVTLVVGFIGSVLFFMSFFTDHLVTQGNENLFLANPLTLIIFFIGLFSFFSSSAKIERIIAFAWYILALLSILLLFLKLFPAFDQDNYMVLALLLPINIGFAVAFGLKHHFKL